MPSSARAEAIAHGLPHYVDESTCKNGHKGRRYVTNYQCVECALAPKPNHVRLANNEKRRRRYAKNPDKFKAWNKKHREKWLAADPTGRRRILYERLLRYYAQNPERVNTHNRNRRSMLRGREDKHTPADIERIHNLQKGRCAYCRKKLNGQWSVDHIQPLSKGGSNSPRNLQLTCRPCNSKKWAKDPIEFAQGLGKLL